MSKSKVALLKIKAHELRALSASWSYFNRTPVEDVIKAAVWSSRSTFAKFYLRDLNRQVENLRLLGPVVSAQKGGGGPSGLSNQDCLSEETIVQGQARPVQRFLDINSFVSSRD